MAGEKIIRVMREVVKMVIESEKMSDVLFGQVLSANPLKIKIDNRFEVTSNFLVLSPFCQEFKSKDGVILWDGLKAGDKVNLLRFNKGQKFYVLDKGGSK